MVQERGSHDGALVQPRGATPRLRSGAAAERSYPAPEVRGSGWEELPHAWGQGQRLRGATPRLRSGAAAERSYPTSEERSSGWEELPHIWGKKQRLRGATPHLRKEVAAALCWSSREERPHIQGKRNPSNMVGTERGDQRADRLKLQSQTSSLSDHMDHSLVLLNETKPYHVGPPKMARSLWRGLTECDPLEKGMANHFSILALRTPLTVWKGKKIGHWKMNSPGR